MPFLIAYGFAAHFWFQVYDPNLRRWYIWDALGDRRIAGTEDIVNRYGHVLQRKDDYITNNNIGNVLIEWKDEDASRILTTLSRSDSYPNKEDFQIMPGPNCATFIDWVLRESRVPWDIHPLAAGKDYDGLISLRKTTTRTGAQIDTPLIGFKAGLMDGVELHLFGLTVGLDLLYPAVKLPFGRFGFSE